MPMLFSHLKLRVIKLEQSLATYEVLTSASEVTSKYIRLAKEHGLTPVELALGFTRDRSFVTSSIIGATSVDQRKSDNMTDKWHVYMTNDGRISLAGLSLAKCEYLANAIIDSFHNARTRSASTVKAIVDEKTGNGEVSNKQGDFLQILLYANNCLTMKN
ncbi:hypothetical protein Syun_014350 [Stephania yunnanensis]|uniref:NADP-dependent oxidoreductase domain-containing protein n=1 Tax=Stephania yunnanensis TaxID=152371 RepID=A0AAP0JJZ0_9MAGN